MPKTKLIGYYSDAYKLEFVLPKYAMYRRVLANVLADEFVRPGVLSETDAVALGTRLLARQRQGSVQGVAWRPQARWPRWPLFGAWDWPSSWSRDDHPQH